MKARRPPAGRARRIVVAAAAVGFFLILASAVGREYRAEREAKRCAAGDFAACRRACKRSLSIPCPELVARCPESPAACAEERALERERR